MEKEQKKNNFITADRLKRLIPAVLSSLALALAVFVVAPLDIYGSNYEQLDFTFANFMPFLALGAVLTVLLFSALMFLLPKKAYRFVFAFVLSTAALFIIQQNFLNFGMNSLPGDRLPGELPSVGLMILDLAIWLIVYGGAFYLAARVNIKGDNGEIIKTISLVVAFTLIVTQTVSPIFIIVNSNSRYGSNILSGSGKAERSTITTERGFCELASAKNVYYFCIDRFDEDYAEKAYNAGKDVFSELDGFTWYRDNVSVYGHTFPAVANMLTGAKFDIYSKRAEYLDNAYKGDDIPLNTLDKNGYAVNIYTMKYYSFTNAEHLPEYIGNLSKATDETDDEPSFALSANMAAFSLYRAAPVILKQIFDSGSTSDVNGNVTKKGEDGYGEWIGTNKQAERLAKKEITVGGNERQFSFIHFDGMHDVLQLSNPYIPSILNRNMSVVNAFLKSLKENGLYKDATIIITGDHSRPFNDLTGVGESRRTALFVKPAGEDEGFKISSAETSHTDIWATIFASEGIEYDGEGKPVFEIAEDETRERTFIWHTYLTASLDEYTYKISGKAANFKNWKESGRRHADKFLMS